MKGEVINTSNLIYLNAGAGVVGGIPVPVNTAIVNMIHEIESGMRKISVLNLGDPVFDRFN